MGLLDAIGGFAKRAGAAIGRGIGHFGTAVKRFGEFAVPAVKRIGQFALDNHQPIALGLQGLSDAFPENKVLRNVAGASMIGSAFLTAKGIGNNYAGLRPPQ